MHYPPPPWRLAGDAVFILRLLPADRVRAFVPPELSIIRVAPGRTLGGVYFAAYNAGSVLEYRELIVIPALVRFGRSIGAWVSHIYVDDERSRIGGRTIWGLPKQLAEFAWDAEMREAIVRNENGVLCTLRSGNPRLRARLPLLLPALSRCEDRFVSFSGRGAARIGLSRGRVEVPPSSPFYPLGLATGTALHFRRLEMRVHAPAPLAS